MGDDFVPGIRAVDVEPARIRDWPLRSLPQDFGVPRAPRGGFRTFRHLKGDALAQLFAETHIGLPDALKVVRLAPGQGRLPEGLAVPDDLATDAVAYDLVIVPVSIVSPAARCVRLRLRLSLSGTRKRLQPVFYDLAPKNKSQVKKWFSGQFALDIGKMLQFVMASAAEPPVVFRIEAPFSWQTRRPTVQASNEMSRKALWYVADKIIEHGFTAATIVRRARDDEVRLTADLALEFRRPGPAGIMHAAQGRTHHVTYAL